MKNRFERDLPSTYKPVFTIDGKDTKTGLIMNGLALLIMGITLGIALPLWLISGAPYVTLTPIQSISALLIFAFSMLFYIVMHELVHGIAYKALTRERLTFGISWSCAFCGVPNIYVYRGAALVALVAPLITFTLILVPLCIWMYFVHPIYYLYSVILLAMHLGGCVGDDYVTLLFLFKFKDKTTLVQDTGPKQTIYVKEVLDDGQE